MRIFSKIRQFFFQSLDFKIFIKNQKSTNIININKTLQFNANVGENKNQNVLAAPLSPNVDSLVLDRARLYPGFSIECKITPECKLGFEGSKNGFFSFSFNRKTKNFFFSDSKNNPCTQTDFQKKLPLSETQSDQGLAGGTEIMGDDQLQVVTAYCAKAIMSVKCNYILLAFFLVITSKILNPDNKMASWTKLQGNYNNLFKSRSVSAHGKNKLVYYWPFLTDGMLENFYKRQQQTDLTLQLGDVVSDCNFYRLKFALKTDKLSKTVMVFVCLQIVSQTKVFNLVLIFSSKILSKSIFPLIKQIIVSDIFILCLGWITWVSIYYYISTPIIDWIGVPIQYLLKKQKT